MVEARGEAVEAEAVEAEVEAAETEAEVKAVEAGAAVPQREDAPLEGGWSMASEERGSCRRRRRREAASARCGASSVWMYLTIERKVCAVSSSRGRCSHLQ